MIYSAPYAIVRIILNPDIDPVIKLSPGKKFNLCIFTVQYLQISEYRGRNRPFDYKIAKNVQFVTSSGRIRFITVGTTTLNFCIGMPSLIIKIRILLVLTFFLIILFSVADP
jgi:hypothetical protein